MRKKLLSFLLLATLLLSACSSSMGSASTQAPAAIPSTTTASRADNAILGESAPAGGTDALDGKGAQAPAAPISPGGQPAVDTGRKLIRTGSYNLETMDFLQTIQEIEALVNRLGGYIESSSTAGGAAREGYSSPRWASFVLRLPADQFFEAGQRLSEIAAVIHSSQNAQEVTDYYYDTEARLKTLRVQEERLIALMGQATELEAVILLEQRLSEVRYSIESQEGTLRRLDSQIAFSTLQLEVQEVFEPTETQPVPVTLAQRIQARFKSTLLSIRRGFESFLVVVLGDGLGWLINLAWMAAAVLIGYRVYKRVQKKRRARQAEPPVSPNPPEKSPETPPEAK